MFLSIIIPAYNVQGYLEKCVQSCLNQNIDLSSYEIIIVNDGSNDGTKDVAEQLAKLHNNIKIINQINKGQSVARNTALKHAIGDYIWFIDADDYIPQNILSHLYHVLLNNNLDALWFQWEQIDENGCTLPKERNWIQKEDTAVTDGASFFNIILGNCFYAWSFIWKRYFLQTNHFHFKENIYYEDLEAYPFLLAEAPKVKYEPIICYYYLQRKSSTLHSVNPKLLDSLLYIISRYEDEIPQYPQISNRLKNIQQSTIRLCLNTISHSYYKKFRSKVFTFINHKKYPRISPYNSFIGKLMNFLWKINERSIIIIYKLIFFTKKCF